MEATELLQFVDIETARQARGLRLVAASALPSPWTEAAKGLFRLQGLPALGVRFVRGDRQLREWTGAHNVPVVLHDDEPPRTGWAEILALAERLGGHGRLVPADPELRVRMHGLAHELAGEGGFGWCCRLVMIHGTMTTGGARSFPLPIAEYLARKYGYSPERAVAARERLLAVTKLFDEQLARSHAAGHAYLLGDTAGALDVSLATFLNPVLATDADCPGMRPEPRAAFAYLAEQIAADVPSALVAHRALMYRQHLPWPIGL